MVTAEPSRELALASESRNGRATVIQRIPPYRRRHHECGRGHWPARPFFNPAMTSTESAYTDRIVDLASVEHDVVPAQHARSLLHGDRSGRDQLEPAS